MHGFKTVGNRQGFIDKIFTFMLRILYNLNKNFFNNRHWYGILFTPCIAKGVLSDFGFILFWLACQRGYARNTPRSDVTVTIKMYNCSVAMFCMFSIMTRILLLHDTVYNIYASRGRSPSIMIWAVQNSGTTDSLFLMNFSRIIT